MLWVGFTFKGEAERSGCKVMKLYKISQNKNTDYDTYDSAIVCAENEEEARKIHPCGMEGYNYPQGKENWEYEYGTWCSSPEDVIVEYIGEAKEGIKKGVISASFNAG
jgi:hypothetical protein